MTKSHYLYGASVQGIQNFIFRTNELKDIVGASELVKKICTDMFQKYKGNGCLVVNAAGNVKCIYSSREECAKAVLNFPREVMEAAPGVTISEAVVPLLSDDSDFETQVEELERRLHIQRNKPHKSLTYGNIAMVRSRTTGLPAVQTLIEKGEVKFQDEATIAKRRFSEASNKNNPTTTLAKDSFGNDYLSFKSLAFDIKDLTEKNDWIAIIHADGNGLGQIVATMNKEPGQLKEFSEKLDKATIRAAQQTYADIVKGEDFDPKSEFIPFRPVVLGGDDMTMICRASLALEYTKNYIQHFEENTEQEGYGLTACAGIAYLKSSYPFHYGYRLAEALCEQAKKDAKRKEHLTRDGKAPSCIMFHKIQGSYISGFNQIERDELTIDDNHSLKFGPYYIHDLKGRWTIDKLQKIVKELSKENASPAKADIRQWLTLMHDNIDYAKQKEERVKNISEKENRELFLQATQPETRNGISVYPAFDALSLYTVENQNMQKPNEEH